MTTPSAACGTCGSCARRPHLARAVRRGLDAPPVVDEGPAPGRTAPPAGAPAPRGPRTPSARRSRPGHRRRDVPARDDRAPGRTGRPRTAGRRPGAQGRHERAERWRHEAPDRYGPGLTPLPPVRPVPGPGRGTVLRGLPPPARRAPGCATGGTSCAEQAPVSPYSHSSFTSSLHRAVVSRRDCGFRRGGGRLVGGPARTSRSASTRVDEPGVDQAVEIGLRPVVLSRVGRLGNLGRGGQRLRPSGGVLV